MKIFTVSAWFFTIMPRYDSFLSLQSTAWFQAQFDLTLAALGKNVKKQQEVSDLNQDYEWLSTWAISVKSSRSDRPQRQWHPFVPIQMEWNKGIPPAGYVNTVDSWLIFDQTLIIHLRCSENAINRPIWLPDARMLKTISVAIKLT